jgi:hypothetical protein
MGRSRSRRRHHSKKAKDSHTQREARRSKKRKKARESSRRRSTEEDQQEEQVLRRASRSRSHSRGSERRPRERGLLSLERQERSRGSVASHRRDQSGSRGSRSESRSSRAQSDEGPAATGAHRGKMAPEAEAGAGATEQPSSSSITRIEETPEDRLWEWVVNGQGQTCSTWDEVEYRGVARALLVKAPNRTGSFWNILCPLDGCDVWKGDSENDLRHHVLGKSKEEALMTAEELQNHRAMMHANRRTTRQYDKLWVVRENMRHRRNLILMGYKLPAINAEEQALLEERRPTWEWKKPTSTKNGTRNGTFRFPSSRNSKSFCPH